MLRDRCCRPPRSLPALPSPGGLQGKLLRRLPCGPCVGSRVGCLPRLPCGLRACSRVSCFSGYPGTAPFIRPPRAPRASCRDEEGMARLSSAVRIRSRTSRGGAWWRWWCCARESIFLFSHTNEFCGKQKRDRELRGAGRPPFDGRWVYEWGVSVERSGPPSSTYHILPAIVSEHIPTLVEGPCRPPDERA